MAKRRHTPDILARQSHEERPHTAPDSSETRPAVPPVQPANEPISPDPLAVLFPREPQAAPSFSARIQLTVTAPDALAKEVEHCLTQAFHALADVQLVTDSADWTLLILGVTLQTPSRGVHGVALSIVVNETPDHQVQEWLLARERGARSRLAPLSETKPVSPPSFFKGAWLRVGAPTQLSQLCKQVVADFNNRYLEKRRAA